MDAGCRWSRLLRHRAGNPGRRLRPARQSRFQRVPHVAAWRSSALAMRTIVAVVSGIVLTLVVGALGSLLYVRATGLESRSAPGVLETRVARLARSVAVPAAFQHRRNPVAS